MAVTLRDRYGEARDIAGKNAVNRGSLANRMAKQAAAMSNNSKMTQAILSSQAMNDAVSQGFDEGIQTGANIAAQVASEEAREKEREQNQKQFEASQALTKEENEKNRKLQSEENKKNRLWNFASQVGGSMLSGLWG